MTGPVERLAPAEAEALLAHFLREAEAPVEPFSSLLEAMIRRRELSLWDLHPESAGARDGFFRALPRDHPACMACECFPICQGYGAHVGGCETCRVILGGLAAAARDLARLGRDLAPPSNPGASHART